MPDGTADREISRGLADLMRRTQQFDLCKSLDVMVRRTTNHFDRFAQRYANIITWEERKRAFSKLATFDAASGYVPDVPGDLDAATANLYAASVHVYSVEIALSEGDFELRIGGHGRLVGEDGETIFAILTAAEAAAKRILSIEPALKSAPFASDLGFTGLDYRQAIPDLSYSTEPHWKELGFRRFFLGTARALRRALDSTYIPATDVSIDAAMLGSLVARHFPKLHTLNVRMLDAELYLRERAEDSEKPSS